MSPTTLPISLGWGGSSTVGCSSTSMNTRSAAAMAACMMLYFSARSRIGWKARSVYWKKADQHAQGHYAGKDAARPVPEEKRQCDRGEESYHRIEQCDRLERVEVGLEVISVQVVEVVELALLAVEKLHHEHPGKVLLQEGVDSRQPDTLLAESGAHPSLEPPACQAR